MNHVFLTGVVTSTPIVLSKENLPGLRWAARCCYKDRKEDKNGKPAPPL